MRIGTREIGAGHPCLIVAEVAQAHDGSLGNAHAFIDAVAEAGADAVKFQCHLADPVSEWRIEPEWPQDENRAAYWRRTCFEPDQWAQLAHHASQRGLIFLCSPFSVDAVVMLDGIVEAWKVPSGRITDRALLEAIGGTGKPVILSAGMCTTDELQTAIAAIHGFRAYVPTIRTTAFAVLHCTSMYPTPADHAGLSILADPDEWPPRQGLSDHSGTIWPSVAAVALGASIVEVHVCWSRRQFGFDTSSSVTVDELRQLVEGVRFTEAAMRPVDKDAMAEELAPMRALFMGREAACR